MVLQFRLFGLLLDHLPADFFSLFVDLVLFIARDFEEIFSVEDIARDFFELLTLHLGVNDCALTFRHPFSERRADSIVESEEDEGNQDSRKDDEHSGDVAWPNVPQGKLFLANLISPNVCHPSDYTTAEAH